MKSVEKRDDMLKHTINRNDTAKVNHESCMNLFHLMSSSLGPLGFDKLIRDDLGDIVLTNDGATILDMIPLKQPAARLLRDLALSQDSQSGDGTTSVVLLACEMLRLCHMLIGRQNIGLDVVLNGLTIAKDVADELLVKQMNSQKTDTFIVGNNVEALEKLAQQILHSKYVRYYRDHFASIIVNAMVDNNQRSRIEMMLIPARTISDSFMVKGLAIDISDRTSVAMQLIHNLSIPINNILLLNVDSRSTFNSSRSRQYKVETVVDQSDEESDWMELTMEQKCWNHIIQNRSSQSPIIVFMASSFPYRTISVRGNGSTVHIVDNIGSETMKNLERCFGTTEVSLELLSQMEDEDEMLDEVDDTRYTLEERIIADRRVLVLARNRDELYRTIVVHGPSDIIVREVQRALHDAISVIGKLLFPDSKSDNSPNVVLVGGGGCVELNIWKALNDHSLTIYNSNIQLVVKAFADSLLVIPRQLLMSIASSQDVEYCMSQLKLSYRNTDASTWSHTGIDVNTTPDSRICDMLRRGIVDSLHTKRSMIKLATEACILLLRIDETVYCPPTPMQQ